MRQGGGNDGGRFGGGPEVKLVPHVAEAGATGEVGAGTGGKIAAVRQRRRSAVEGREEGGRRAASGMRMWVKLDLRPGPYGQRPWLAEAPVLAQFVHGLALRNVSFELHVPGVSPSCGEVETAGWSGPAKRRRTLTWPLLTQGPRGNGSWFDKDRPAGGGSDGGASWLQELLPYTIRVEEEALVTVRVSGVRQGSDFAWGAGK